MSLGWPGRKTRKSRSPGRRSRPRGAANSKPALVIFRRLFPVDFIAEAQRAQSSQLRPEDYNASLRVVENLYTGGATSNQVAIARLTLAKQLDELQAVTDRVTMDVRLAFYELLLNREKIHVREQSVAVLREEFKSQRERLSAGLVGPLDASRAEVALANEEPELIQAQTDLRNSYLRLNDLCGIDGRSSGDRQFEAVGSLQYEPRHPTLNDTLARALINRPEIKSAAKGCRD